MTPGQIAVRADDSVEHVQNMMMQYGIGQVPVVEDNRPIGIVTRTDLIKLWSRPEGRPQRVTNLSDRLAGILPPKLLDVLRQAGDLADGWTSLCMLWGLRA